MALAQPSPYRRIVRDPDIQGGEPTVRGTRVPVRAIVVAWRENFDVQDLLAAYPRLSVDDVREALDFYDEFRDEIDRRIKSQSDGD